MIYDNIKSLCESRDLSIRALEMKAGVPNGTIGRWKGNEDAQPRATTIKKIARALGVSMATILKDDREDG